MKRSTYTSKNSGSRTERNGSKRVKLQQQSSSQQNQNNSNDDGEFQKLDQTNAVHARRIQQRRRMVVKGKNTIGYDEYLKKVPRHRRRPRSMEHPRTPDHTLDIPTKRWQGLVRAWRRALHKYDPPNLMEAFNESADAAADVATNEPTTATMTTTTPSGKSVATATAASSGNVQAKQLSEAVKNGLLVDVSSENWSSITTNDDVATETTLANIISPSGGGAAVGATKEEKGLQPEVYDELAEFEAARDDDDFLIDEEDSDDDLL